MRILFYFGIAALGSVGTAARVVVLAALVLLPVLGALYFPTDGAWRAPAVAALYAVALYFIVCFALLSAAGVERISLVVDRIALGDLTVSRSAKAADAASGGMWHAIGRMGDALGEIVKQVKKSCEVIVRTAREVADGYQNLSQRTEEQASTLEQTAAGMEQFSGTVKQNAEHCRRARALAEEASAVAGSSAQAMREVTRTMSSLEESAKKVGEIIGVIEGIAFQTNILALNAAVEAARAGEQGRGFAVVAAEVRALAQRSAEAAKAVKALIGESTAGVGAGVRQVEQAAGTIERAVASVRTVSGVIEEIATASAEQTTGVAEIGRAILQLESVTQQNAALVEQAAAAALSFEDEASKLFDAVNAFKIDKMEERARSVALVERAVRHVKKVGPQRAFDDFDDKNGGFIQGEYYIAAFNMDGARTAVGASPAKRGEKPRRGWWEQVLPIAQRGKGWLDYSYTNPRTGKTEWKSSYFARVGDYLVCCGFYREQTEVERLLAERIAQQEAQAAGRPLRLTSDAAGRRKSA